MTKNAKKEQISIISQYLKDISFENPRAPLSLTKAQFNPNISLNIDVNVNKLSDNNFEVTLKVHANASDKEDPSEVFFIIEVEYSGVFALENISEEKQEEVLLVHCPNILFPYARRIVSDNTREGGFPPLMMNPVDFYSLYVKRKSSPDSDTSVKNTVN